MLTPARREELRVLSESPGTHDSTTILEGFVDLLAEVDALEARQQELLVLVRRLTYEVPLPDEAEGWIGQRAALLAEVGTLRARAAELERGAPRPELPQDGGAAGVIPAVKNRVDADLVVAHRLLEDDTLPGDEFAALGEEW